MIPTFLKKYETDLSRYKRNVVRIHAQAIDGHILSDDLKVTDSKFLGIPFFPKSKAYPKDKHGKPMVMLAQLNFEQIPTLQHFPEHGILQLFFSTTDWYDDGFKIMYHSEKELKEPFFDDFSFLSEQDYEEIPVYKLHKLHFDSGIDNGGSSDSQFDYLFDDMDYYDFMENLNKSQEEEFTAYFNAEGHKIGGYAEFTQGDPRDYDAELSDDIQVLQIDVDDHIMFGDSGLGHIFISLENLIKKDFSKAYFYWDCC